MENIATKLTYLNETKTEIKAQLETQVGTTFESDLRTFLRIMNLLGNVTLTSIPIRAFEGCGYNEDTGEVGLQAISIPSSVTIISEYAFSQCTSLSLVTISDGVETIKSGAFQACTQLPEITLPDSVTTINDHIFSGCSNLTAVSLSNNIATIPQDAFHDCTSLTAISIPDNVTTVETEAFLNCSGLTTLQLSENIETLGEDVFKNCNHLSRITCLATAPPTVDQNWHGLDNTNNCPIYVPAAATVTYRSTSGWSNYATRIRAIPEP